MGADSGCLREAGCLPAGSRPPQRRLGGGRHYASTFSELPPIRVQKDTFVVIDGSLRLEAAEEVGSLCILVVEEDVPDGELAVEAFKANLHHGLPYEEDDRRRGSKDLLGIDESADRVSRLVERAGEAIASALLATETELVTHTLL